MQGTKTWPKRCRETLCEGCNFPTAESKTTEVLKLVHMDICGPMPVKSNGGARFVATFTDDYSKLSVVEILKAKGSPRKW